MLDEYRELIDLLAQTPSRLKEEAAAAGSPADGEWTAAQILGHLATAEYYFVERLQKLIGEKEPYLKSFADEATERQKTMMDNDIETNLQAFNELRGETVSMLMSLALNLWERAGTHQTEGRLSIEDVVETMITHDIEHIEQLQSLRAS